MEWLIFIVIIVFGYLYLRSKGKKADLSMLPEQFVVLDLETTGLYR